MTIAQILGSSVMTWLELEMSDYDEGPFEKEEIIKLYKSIQLPTIFGQKFIAGVVNELDGIITLDNILISIIRNFYLKVRTLPPEDIEESWSTLLYSPLTKHTESAYTLRDRIHDTFCKEFMALLQPTYAHISYGDFNNVLPSHAILGYYLSRAVSGFQDNDLLELI